VKIEWQHLIHSAVIEWQHLIYSAVHLPNCSSSSERLPLLEPPEAHTEACAAGAGDVTTVG
jgi:hypothetical protein